MMNTDIIETIEPFDVEVGENAWWVSFYLQDGTQCGGTYDGDDIDDVERQIMQEYGEMFGGIADYGRYADID